MKLLNTYKGVLRALNVTVLDNGDLYYNGLSQYVPWTLNREDPRQMVLPTQKYLSEGDWTTRCAWHPMSEHLDRGVSAVMNATLRAGVMRLSEVIINLMEQFIELGIDVKRQHKVAPKAQAVLTAVKTADKGTLTRFTDIVGKMVENKAGDLSPITMYLRREGLYKGLRSRVCMVSSPLLKTILESERCPGGVQIRQQDQLLFENLIEHILPGIDNPETYSAPSESKLAPYFESFLYAYEKVATQLNSVIHVNRKELKDVEKLMINLDWGDLAEDLQRYRTDIPPLEDSKGKALATDTQAQQPVTSAAANAPVTQPNNPAQVSYGTQQAQQLQPVATPQVDDSNLSIAERLARRSGVPTAPVMAAYPGMVPGTVQPVMQYPQQPVMQQPVQIPPGMVMLPNGQLQYAQHPAVMQPAAPVTPGYHRPVNNQPVIQYQQQVAAAAAAPPWMVSNDATVHPGMAPAMPHGMVYPGVTPMGQPVGYAAPVASTQPLINI